MQCEVCNVTCNRKDMLEKHKQGKKHLKNLLKFAPKILPTSTPTAAATATATSPNVVHCEICNVVCNNQQVFKAIMELASANGVFTATPNYPARCQLCNISCTSIDLLNNHMKGKKHLKKLKISQQIAEASTSLQGNAVNCELCGIGCDTNDVLKRHISGKKHQKKLLQSQNVFGSTSVPAQDLVNEEGKLVNVDGRNQEAKRQKKSVAGVEFYQ